MLLKIICVARMNYSLRVKSLRVIITEFFKVKLKDFQLEILVRNFMRIFRIQFHGVLLEIWEIITGTGILYRNLKSINIQEVYSQNLAENSSIFQKFNQRIKMINNSSEFYAIRNIFDLFLESPWLFHYTPISPTVWL